MELIQVTGKYLIDDFHKVPEQIYKDDPNWIPQLRMMIEDTFDPAKNARFQKGDARRWVLKQNGKLIGRIAAFYDEDYSSGYDQPTGCCGFFECINDKKAAFKLFDTAHDWLKEKGMEAMDGPINFDENFFFWGLLKDGFQPQTFGMQYNPAYFNELFEAYGFKTYYDQYSYSLDITNPDLPERFWKIAEWVAQKPGYTFEHFSFKNQDKCIRDFLEIHEKAWGNHGNYKPIEFRLLKDLLTSAKIILDEEFIWYAYHDGKPIAFFMQILDLNQILKKLKTGKLNLWQGLKLLYLKKRRTITRCRVIVLGVIPGYQGKGIESAIFHHLKKVMLRKSWYNDMEMSWIGDFNPKMNAMFKSFGADRTNTHSTLRYLFDREKEFVRAPIIE
ncbi:GNAT family N-acetyltransferase [Draconibacterium sp. IB214405]|uniref:GNAT family N-acetyltransferase n=1 Tax=Draconibacterium sp. IB214405 TaxID=3097352 RepID=UPI002A0EF22A|nr:GNAT family N-acetyltransferase [Draconibacterium sp. IB214405]MDX8341466.1 GNAT family N-acetyltransferase [Draconibacterium sp. IB214405]